MVAEDSKKVASELASEIGKLQRSAGTSPRMHCALTGTHIAHATSPPGNPDPLSGTRWLLRLDFGREEGTWMDAR